MLLSWFLWSSASWHWLGHNVRCSHLPQVSDFISIFILATSVENPLVLRHIFSPIQHGMGWKWQKSQEELRDSLILWHQVWKEKKFLRLAHRNSLLVPFPWDSCRQNSLLWILVETGSKEKNLSSKHSLKEQENSRFKAIFSFLGGDRNSGKLKFFFTK